ncbi:altronate dehydratase family protein [Algoriphagus halophytocola]|uniref:Altronate dehydratase family protein n=1 Tax=Algoriphagus halophytocola TaxID=2991499 RepID=A0ABY6MLU4_9BACT|nr:MULTISPECIES: altronate dehydratase family protein [unclassified Algoriphagus]UZD24514.1 altronate dehydratase family protein [Algoriphagus sp. TR-M5]WBL41878.1 altronate dehydratase family protein [Algoriphagus sp. TR-M9]
MNHKTLQIHPKDNVLVALQDLSAGEIIPFSGKDITLLNDIPAKHKFAISDLPKDEKIYMYGGIVGKSLFDIPQGGVLSTQNVIHEAEDFGKKATDYHWDAPDISKFKDRTFNGFHRPDGQVGTGNYWLVVPMVFCENRNVDIIKDAFVEELGFSKPNPFKKMVKEMAAMYKSGKKESIETVAVETLTSKPQDRLFENIDGIKFLNHQGGCGGIRQDSEALCTLIAGYVNNPNVAGATILSLGCQNAQSSYMEEKLAKINPNFSKPLIILEQQKEGTEQQLLSRAIKETFVGMAEANLEVRKPAPLSKLTVGLECGGSDGFSGISANPSVGYAADLLVALGGKAILSEFPELCGVEQDLINRCVTDESAEKFSKLMRAYAASAEAVGSGFDMNPSPGNIKDGLITDAMKSSGAAKKGGTSPVTDVLDYGEYVKNPGLNLLCTPGNDVESTTAMAGSGANMILFTTGLGTPTGNPIAPVIKVSSNHKLAEKMPDIIDINTGYVISGEKTIQEMGEEILDKVIKIASGEEQSKAMILGQDDFIPWKRGVSL